MDLKSNYPNNLNFVKSLMRSLTDTQNYQRYAEESQIKVLVMLSGGIDSVALLTNLLAYTECEVHVHHVQLVNYNNYNQAELETIQEIIDFCLKNYREFSYSFSFVEEKYGGSYSCGLDSELWAFKAARICKSHHDIDIVAMGMSEKESVLQSYDIFKSVVNSDGYLGDRLPQLVFPKFAVGIKDSDIYESMPKELADICWSCRNPIKYEETYLPCRACHTCRKRSFIRRDLWLKSEYERHQKILRVSWFSEKDKFLKLVKEDKPDLTYLLVYALENSFPNRRMHLLLDSFAKEIKADVQADMDKQDVINFMVLDSAWTQENFENRITLLIKAGAQIDKILSHDSHKDEYYKEFVEFFKSNLSDKLLTEAALSLRATDANLNRFRILIEAGADKKKLKEIGSIYPELQDLFV